MANKKYYLYVRRKKVEVNEEVYKTYYQEIEKEKYEQKKQRVFHVMSYNSLDTDEQLGEETLEDMEAEPVDDVLVRNFLIEQLRRSLGLLNEDEMELIQGLFYQGMSEREYAEKIGLSQKGVNKRKVKILSKLKKVLEI